MQHLFQGNADEANRLKVLEADIKAAEKQLGSLTTSSAGLTREADSLQAKIDAAGGETLKKKKLIIANIQEVKAFIADLQNPIWPLMFP